MKLILHRGFGGFAVSDFVVETLGLDDPYLLGDRADDFIDLWMQYGPDICSGAHANIWVIEIPDEATDWEIIDYDGFERVVYVLDGKLKFA